MRQLKVAMVFVIIGGLLTTAAFFLAFYWAEVQSFGTVTVPQKLDTVRPLIAQTRRRLRLRQGVVQPEDLLLPRAGGRGIVPRAAHRRVLLGPLPDDEAQGLRHQGAGGHGGRAGVHDAHHDHGRAVDQGVVERVVGVGAQAHHVLHHAAADHRVLRPAQLHRGRGAARDLRGRVRHHRGDRRTDLLHDHEADPVEPPGRLHVRDSRHRTSCRSSSPRSGCC